MYALLCEDSINSVFCGIYEAWAGGYDREEVVLRTGGVQNYELFMEYRKVPEDALAGQKVANTIRRRFGEEMYERICYALWSDGEDKADAVYRMVRYGIEHNCGYGFKNHLTNEAVQRVFELWRRTYNEAHHFLGFLRFFELESGVLHANIHAKNQVLEPLAVHFSDRLPGENWVICEKNRKIAAVHPSHKDWFFIEEEQILPLFEQKRSRLDEEFSNMWSCFCNSISIEARKNLKLQRQNLPLRFRGDMV